LDTFDRYYEQLLEALPSIPEPLGLVILVLLVAGTLGHLIYRVGLILTRGFALHIDIPEIKEMIGKGRDYGVILGFMDNHARGSKYPIVAAIREMIDTAQDGLSPFVGQQASFKKTAGRQTKWFNRWRSLPMFLWFTTLMILIGKLHEPLGYSTYLWIVIWTISGYWGSITFLRLLAGMASEGVNEDRFWDIYSTLMTRLVIEDDKYWREQLDRAAEFHSPYVGRVDHLSLVPPSLGD